MKKIPTETTVEIDHKKAGSDVRVLRLAKEMKLRWLAVELGISAPYLCDLENGKRNWTTERFDKAIKILNKA